MDTYSTKSEKPEKEQTTNHFHSGGVSGNEVASGVDSRILDASHSDHSHNGDAQIEPLHVQMHQAEESGHGKHIACSDDI